MKNSIEEKQVVSNLMHMCEWQRVSVGGTHVLPVLLSAESSNKDKDISHHNTSEWYCAGGYFLWLILDTRPWLPVVFADLAVEMCVVFVSYVYMVYSLKPDFFSPLLLWSVRLSFFWWELWPFLFWKQRWRSRVGTGIRSTFPKPQHHMSLSLSHTHTHIGRFFMNKRLFHSVLLSFPIGGGTIWLCVYPGLDS